MFEISIHLPDNLVTNEDLREEFPDWDFTKIQNKVGILKRYIADKNETAIDLAYKASEKLFNKINKEAIDFFILCTQSPDYMLPTSACILQDRLGLSTSIGALDFNLGCSGYIYGLAIAKGLLTAGISKNLLLVTSETYSKHIYKKDIANRAIFGDAATATLITKDDVTRIKEFSLGTNGEGKDNLIVRNSGFRYPFDPNAQEIEYGSGNYYTYNNLYMNGPEIYNFTIDTVPTVVRKNLIENNLDINDLDYYVFHQANRLMLDYLRIKIGIPTEKFCIDLENTGNTVSNTIPIALKNAYDRGIIRKGNKVMLVGFGVGYSWGAVTIEI